MSSKRARWLGVGLLCTVIAFVGVESAVGQVADTDSDGIPDEFDNCVLEPNGPLAGSCPFNDDGDEDGYGNACDSDFNQDGGTGLDDLTDLLTLIRLPVVPPPQYDLNCDGAIGLDDLSRVLQEISLPPGPSGLDCAVLNQQGACPPL